jgi:molybdate transport system substrate-binding protein
MMRVFDRLFMLVLAVLLAGGCQDQTRTLLFHAGAGQRSSLDEIVAIFEERNPQVEVELAYKGSGYFLADVEASREGDLYMPGEEFYLRQAAERGFIRDYHPGKDLAAYFVTVILTPAGNPKGIRKVADFAKPGVRVGLGDPQACAVGEWHLRIFKQAGIYEQVKKNAVMNAQCIPEIGNACKLGAIDGSIVWAATAVLYLCDAEIIPMEEKYRGLIPLPVGVLTFSRHPELAGKLKDFILSKEAREIFHKHAYTVDPGQVDQDLEWLVTAARVAKDPAVPITAETVGHLVEEVRRQRR